MPDKQVSKGVFRDLGRRSGEMILKDFLILNTDFSEVRVLGNVHLKYDVKIGLD